MPVPRKTAVPSALFKRSPEGRGIARRMEGKCTRVETRPHAHDVIAALVCALAHNQIPPTRCAHLHTHVGVAEGRHTLVCTRDGVLGGHVGVLVLSEETTLRGGRSQRTRHGTRGKTQHGYGWGGAHNTQPE